MKKIFTLLAAALMSVGMYADPNIVTPTISGDLSFTESTTVTMECTSPNSDIYYTTDGVTDPRCDCPAAPEYTHPITITETTIIKAAAFDGDDWSAVAEVTFTKVPASNPATTVTWNSSTLSSIYLHDGGQSFTQDGVTVTSLNGLIDGELGYWQGGSSDASFKFSTSLGNFTKIEITGNIMDLGGSGWTQTSPGAVWTGDANETTFGTYFQNVSQIVFTIEEPAPTAVDNASADQAQAAKAKKIFRDNNVFIEKNGETFTLTGSKVK